MKYYSLLLFSLHAPSLSHLLHCLQSELQLYYLPPQVAALPLLWTERQLILEALDDGAMICYAQLEYTTTHKGRYDVQLRVVHKS